MKWSWEVGSPAMFSEVWISWAGRQCLISPLGTNLPEMWLLNCAAPSSLPNWIKIGFAFCSEPSRSSQECLEVVNKLQSFPSLPKSQTTFTSRDYRKKHF